MKLYSSFQIICVGTGKLCSNMGDYTPPLAAEELFLLHSSPCGICGRTEGVSVMTLSITKIILWVVR